MTLPYTLSRFQGTATRLASDRFQVVDTPAGWLPLSISAALSVDGNPEGQTFQFLVIYNDQTRPELQGDFMVMTGDYSNAGGAEFLENCAVSFSSASGGGSVDFDEGVGNLRIVGVASHDHFSAMKNRENDIRLLAEERTISSLFLPYIENQTTELQNAAANSFVLTPKHENSRLVVDWFAEVFARKNEDGQSFRAGMQMRYINADNASVNRGEFVIYGGITFPNDPNMGLNYPVSSTFELSPTNKNQNGDWEIMPMIRAVDGGTTTSIQSLRLHYRELL